MKKPLFIAALTALLCICGTAQTQNLPSAAPVSQPLPTTPIVEPQASDMDGQDEVALPALSNAKQEALPDVELTPDLLFQYMVSEIAEQRGEWQDAYVNMLDIARQTADPRLARRAAEIALTAKQPGDALAAVRLWHELAPESEEAAQYYLGFLILGDDLSDALPVLQQRLKHTPEAARGNAILQMQRLLARAKNKPAAFAVLEQALQPFDKLVEARLALAQGAFIAGDNERAIKEAQAALKIAPASEIAALTLAQVTPDPAKAAQNLEDFLYTKPASREVRLGLARLLVEQKKYEEAGTTFQVLLKQYPDDLTALYALGLLGTQTGKLEEAQTYLTHYLEVLETRPQEGRDPTQALLVLAQIAEERKDTTGALRWLDQVTPSTPDAYLSAQVRRARLLARSGQLGSARMLLHKLNVYGEAERVQLLAAEAQILYQAEQQEQALSVLQKGLTIFPENVDLLYEQAMMAEKLDQLPAMETSLRKVMQLAPHNQHAYNALGYSLADRNLRLDEAHSLIAKALQLAPEDPFIMDSMGWVLYRMGKPKQAEKHLRQAFEIRQDAEIAAHLGEVLWQQGQQEEARKLWTDAQKLAPDNAILLDTLKRLQVTL